MANYQTWVAGQRMTSTLWSAGQDIYTYKTSDHILNNSAVYTADPEMSFLPPFSNTTYVITAGIIFTTAASTTPDLQFNFAIDVKDQYSNIRTTLNAQYNGMTTDYDGGLNRAFIDVASTGPNATAGVTNTVVSMWLVTGLLITGIVTPGIVTFQWRQNVATAENTTLKAGSWMRISRVK